jgi:hypothetical protein
MQAVASELSTLPQPHPVVLVAMRVNKTRGSLIILTRVRSCVFSCVLLR